MQSPREFEPRHTRRDNQPAVVDPRRPQRPRQRHHDTPTTTPHTQTPTRRPQPPTLSPRSIDPRMSPRSIDPRMRPLAARLALAEIASSRARVPAHMRSLALRARSAGAPRTPSTRSRDAVARPAATPAGTEPPQQQYAAIDSGEHNSEVALIAEAESLLAERGGGGVPLLAAAVDATAPPFATAVDAVAARAHPLERQRVRRRGGTTSQRADDVSFRRFVTSVRVDQSRQSTQLRRCCGGGLGKAAKAAHSSSSQSIGPWSSSP